MAKPLPSGPWSCSADYVWRKLSDGRAFVVHAETGEYLCLNATAARFVDLAERGHDLSAIVDDFARAYAASREELTTDLTALADELAAIGILTSSAGDNHVPGS